MRGSWRAVVAIAATYFYFLLFAQFAFLEGLAERAGGEGFLKPILVAMGLGGLVGSFLAPRMVVRFGGPRVLRAALAKDRHAVSGFLPWDWSSPFGET